jgi:hypothetical protein
MSDVSDIAKTLHVLQLCVQALKNDSVLYFSQEDVLVTPERQAALVQSLKMVKIQVMLIEQNLTEKSNLKSSV